MTGVQTCALPILITGEGHLDAQSFEGKVVGGVQAMCVDAGVPVAAIVGDADDDVSGRIRHVSLVHEFGIERAMREPLWCIEQAALRLLKET